MGRECWWAVPWGLWFCPQPSPMWHPKVIPWASLGPPRNGCQDRMKDARVFFSEMPIKRARELREGWDGRWTPTPSDPSEGGREWSKIVWKCPCVDGRAVQTRFSKTSRASLSPWCSCCAQSQAGSSPSMGPWVSVTLWSVVRCLSLASWAPRASPPSCLPNYYWANGRGRLKT